MPRAQTYLGRTRASVMTISMATDSRADVGVILGVRLGIEHYSFHKYMPDMA